MGRYLPPLRPPPPPPPPGQVGMPTFWFIGLLCSVCHYSPQPVLLPALSRLFL